MIARVLSGGPVFVPRKARDLFQVAFGDKTHQATVDRVWDFRVRGLNALKPPLRFVVPAPVPDSNVIPFPKGAA